VAKSVLIVDDSAFLRKALCKIFRGEEDLDVCGEAENGRDVTCLDFLIHVEVRISTFRRTRWACDNPSCCVVARCCTPVAS
jgi:hypothetical protein